MLAHEVVRGYNRRHDTRRWALKIDIMGAYDTVNWDALNLLMYRLEFPEVMIKWIFMCVSSARYSILVNREVCNYFEGKFGLKQGDPISPLLFTLIIELLSCMLKKGVSRGEFKYHSKLKERS